MARLTIEQIKAPDLSVASQATARAGEAFRKGMSSASDLLSQYQSGLETQGDAELTNLLAGAKNEDEWNSILASTDFSKMNISAGMRQNIMNRRDNILGYENKRADTRLVDANTGNVNATTARTRNATGIDTNQDNRAGELHGVTMADHNWRQGARAEDASLAGAALRAAEESVTNGYDQPGVGGPVSGQSSGAAAVTPGTNTGPRADGSGISVPNPRPAIQANNDDVLMLARTLQAEAGNQGREGMLDVGSVIANRVGDSRYGDGTIRGVVMRRGQFSAWNGETGHAGGEQGQNMNFQPNADAMAAAQAIISGNYKDRTNGATHYVNKNISNPSWGNNVTYQRGDHWFGQADGPGNGQRPTPPAGGPQPRQRVTQNPNQGGPAQQAYLGALANSQYQSTADVLAAYQNQYDYNETGQAAITLADNKLAEEALAQQMLDIAATNVDPTEAVVQFRNENPGATAVERLQFEADVLEATGDGGALSAARLQIGTTGASPNDIGIADAALADISERQQRDRFQVAQNGAGEFTSDPAGMMTSALKGLGISTTPSDVESAINSLAESQGITRAEAAYSYARAAEEETRLGRALSIGGDNLSNWGAERFAQEHFKGENAAIARAALADDRRVAERIQTATSNLGRIERKIQKLRQQGETVPVDLVSQRDEARRAVEGFYEQYGNRGQTDTPPPAGGANPGARIEQSLRDG